MTRTWMVGVVLSLVACGKKRPECDTYAKHVGEVESAMWWGDELEPKRKAVESEARDACNADKVTAAEQACAMGATNSQELHDCAGVGTAAKPGTAIHREGFSLRMPPGWTESNKTEKTEALITGDGVNSVMVLFVAKAPTGIASDDACRTAAARFSGSTGAIMESAGLSTLGHFGSDCRMLHHDAKMKIEGHTYGTPSGGSLIVNCTYAPTLTTTPAFCNDVIETLALN